VRRPEGMVRVALSETKTKGPKSAKSVSDRLRKNVAFLAGEGAIRGPAVKEGGEELTPLPWPELREKAEKGGGDGGSIPLPLEQCNDKPRGRRWVDRLALKPRRLGKKKELQ